MKKLYTSLILTLIFSLSMSAQEMTLTKLGTILERASDSIISQKPQWRFVIKDVPFIAIADSTHNRMRIISPIGESDKLNEELKTASLMANFHTALDVKYAISDNILWSVFIHPLKELTEDQVYDAVSQVYYAHVNFGTTFSSTSLVFPGNKRPQKKPKKVEKKILKKI
ncbi:hypothetical protein [Tenacibaculum jejuense]|uniref:YbjN domain-containing protein n=1 Tax=Tenacibaculum jejuense TaxID=584609 RepID=A0A238U6W8_9FLAO|nr:hypothetical protein [Tenacibaculum jejuense]SNR14338.1 Protein of unknown function precursor [Tenacibaculum jejuense]